VSGAMPPWERPELGPWLTDPVKLVQYDGIVAYDVSRLSREYFDLAWLRKWAEQHHKKLYVIKERLHWPDNRDGTLWGVAAERAHEERQEIIERTVRELSALEEGGKLIGRPPFGYISAGEKYDRYLIPTGEGRTYVPEVYRRCTEGWSMEKIAAWLNDEGVLPVSGVWWARSIAGLIKNPVYMGNRCKREIVPPDEVEERDGKTVRYCYGGVWVETPRWHYGRTVHRCEPLVDAATWKRANDALVNRPNRGHVEPENRAMLSEALFCPFCDNSPMYRHRANNGRGRTYLYYRCFGRGSQRQSCGNMVRVELVDQAVSEIMSGTFSIPVKRYEIVPGNEAELEAELERVKFELRQLAARDLDWEEEDRERARLRAEHDGIAAAELIEDTVELVETDDTYLELWERLTVPERGPWLLSEEFRVTASRESVTVSQGDVSATVKLDQPERQEAARDTAQVLVGRCECGCGSDVYGSKYGNPKRYVNRAHAQVAYRQRLAAAGSSAA
jgi:site-specific DNA recombinase